MKRKEKRRFKFCNEYLKGMSEEQYLTDEDFIDKERKATSD